MPHSRFFLDTSFLVDTDVLLSGEEAHHLQRVMRKQKGDVIEIVNGRNQLAKASILSFEKKDILLRILTLEEQPAIDAIILCQALPRLNRLDAIVEKGTELGMTELWLFPGELSEKKNITTTQLKRLKAVSIAAMKQCGRLDLPKIVLKPALLTWDSLQQAAYFGDLSKTAPSFHSMLTNQQDILFFVGPESGFTAEEEAWLRSNNAKGVCLHSNILRTDTAAIAALSLASQRRKFWI